MNATQQPIKSAMLHTCKCHTRMCCPAFSFTATWVEVLNAGLGLQILQQLGGINTVMVSSRAQMSVPTS